MIARILTFIGLIVFGAGFIWFSGIVIWLGMKDFFQMFKHSNKNLEKTELSKQNAPSNIKEN